MARQLRAFISYRREDAYLLADPGFIGRVKTALEKLGAEDVFVDTGDIAAGDEFEGTIFNALAECDLFVELIGTRWLDLLKAREAAGERDILLREIETALKLDKDVVPLLIDGAPVPGARDLPRSIQQLVRLDAKTVASNSDVDGLCYVLREPYEEARKVRKLGRGWVAAYTVLSIVAWIVCGVLPNAVGLWEYGIPAWTGMMTGWAGFFLWPLFFLPFIMLALYKPFQVLLEATFNARTFAHALTYSSPLAIGLVLALGMTYVETSAPQTPWTIHPKLAASCSGPEDPGPTDPAARAQYDQDRQTLRSYATGEALPADLRNALWARAGEKCWPNAFFYLTVPLNGRVPTAEYLQDRGTVQLAFLRMIQKDDRDHKGSDAPYSHVFPYYVVSFLLIAWLLITATIMAFIYAFVKITRRRDGRVLRSPSEDLYLGLMFGFITMMFWAPFRVNTLVLKTLYNCAEPGGQNCATSIVDQMKNLAMFTVMLVSLFPVAAMVFWRHGRLLQLALAAITLALVGTIVAGFVLYADALSVAAGYWHFWVIVSLFGILFFTVLWYFFNPAFVRLGDFRRSEDED